MTPKVLTKRWASKQAWEGRDLLDLLLHVDARVDELLGELDAARGPAVLVLVEHDLLVLVDEAAAGRALPERVEHVVVRDEVCDRRLGQ